MSYIDAILMSVPCFGLILFGQYPHIRCIYRSHYTLEHCFLIGVGSIRRLEPEVEGREGPSAVKSGVGLSIAFPLPFALVRDQPQDA